MPDPTSPSNKLLKKLQLSPEEQDLRDKLNISPSIDFDNNGFPIKAPTAPYFRPETQVTGSKLAQILEKLYGLAPELRGRATEVTAGFNRSSLPYILNNTDKDPGLRIDLLNRGSFSGSNLLGLTTPDKRIGLSDNYGIVYLDPKTKEYRVLDRSDAEIANTLAHELYHIVGPGGFEEGHKLTPNWKYSIAADPELSENESTKVGNSVEKLYPRIASRKR